MEARLFRLTIALSFLAFVGFGIPAVSSVRQSSDWHALVVDALNNQQKFREKCLASVTIDFRYTDPSCTKEGFEAAESLVNSFVKDRNKAQEEAGFFVPAALGIPAGLFLLFFSGRWILTGKLRKVKEES